MCPYARNVHANKQVNIPEQSRETICIKVMSITMDTFVFTFDSIRLS